MRDTTRLQVCSHLWPDARLYPQHSHQESGNTDISNITSAGFNFQQTVYTLQTHTQDRGSFMLVATLLCLNELRG